MDELISIDDLEKNGAAGQNRGSPVMGGHKPDWLRIRPKFTSEFKQVKQTIKDLGLHTVCEEAHCPNLNECWSGGTATLMVMGDVCTRGCRFCNVKTGFRGSPLDADEPRKVGEAIKGWGLDYVVITSVDRDDLPDQGAGHFAECIRQVKLQSPNTIVEVLIPDFRGNADCIRTIVDAHPDVIDHNIETVRELQKKVRDPRANYDQSLGVLKKVKEMDSSIYTKSSVMLGLGETSAQLVQAMDDLRAIDVDVLTMGQYLQPSKYHLKVDGYVPPEEFERYKKIAEDKGFLYVASGPFVRSSYKAAELFVRGLVKKRAAQASGKSA